MYLVAVLKSRKKINNKKNWSKLFVRKYNNIKFLIKNKTVSGSGFKSKRNLFKKFIKTSFFFNYIFKN